MLLLPDPAGGSPDLADCHHASSRPLSHWTAPACCTCAAPASTVAGEDRCFETGFVPACRPFMLAVWAKACIVWNNGTPTCMPRHEPGRCAEKTEEMHRFHVNRLTCILSSWCCSFPACLRCASASLLSNAFSTVHCFSLPLNSSSAASRGPRGQE